MTLEKRDAGNIPSFLCLITGHDRQNSLNKNSNLKQIYEKKSSFNDSGSSWIVGI